MLVRSGGVIPHIISVSKRVSPALPDDDYIWTEGGVDIVLADVEADEEVIHKKIVRFSFKRLRPNMSVQESQKDSWRRSLTDMVPV